MELITKKKTKIVCTIGPASDTAEMIYKLYQAGMNVMRVNFSHGTHEEQLAKIEIARSFEKKYGIYIPVALDTKGPEIRTGYMENGCVPVKKGQIMRITKTPMKGTSEKFYCTYTGLYGDVKVGDTILIDDGNLEMKVLEKDEKAQEIVVQALNDHYIKDQKGMNLPMSRLSMPYISEQDESDLKFGAEHDMDAIFASFCRRPEDIQASGTSSPSTARSFLFSPRSRTRRASRRSKRSSRRPMASWSPAAIWATRSRLSKFRLSSARSSALPPIRETGHHRDPDARFDDFPSAADPSRSLRRRHRDRRKLRLRHAFGRIRFGPLPGRIRRDASRDLLGRWKKSSPTSS
jgi:hypothetical protein